MTKPIDVVAAIIEKDGKFLIAKRKQGKSLEGKWEFPGGKLEEGETCERGLIRELDEEFGIKVEVKKYLGENIHDYDWVRIKLIGYYAEHISGEFILKDHDRIEWVFPTEFEVYDFADADIPLTKIVAYNYYRKLI